MASKTEIDFKGNTDMVLIYIADFGCCIFNVSFCGGYTGHHPELGMSGDSHAELQER